MAKITERKLNKWRATAARYMPDKIRIQHYSTVPDGRGGTRRVATTTEDVACRVQALGVEEERIYADYLTQDVGYIVYLPYGTDANLTDELTIIERMGVPLAEADQVTLTVDGRQTGQSYQFQLKLITSTTASERMGG